MPTFDDKVDLWGVICFCPITSSLFKGGTTFQVLARTHVGTQVTFPVVIRLDGFWRAQLDYFKSR